jgi:site-specific DNA recombinase
MAEKKRCAIYTRKSTEEGLEQAFNSLDAQREACAAYILSQAHEGWEQVTELYDDGGWSGGSMERPALKQLMADVEAGKVDIIVVYKVDRLTRSLADFAKIVEILDERKASFVSVTQAFNTTNSMGRLTLNVLLSFAQFEREVTGERIRDKIAASKKKGMWMGGAVAHGYRVEERKLLIEEREAEEVRHIFRCYLALKSIPKLADDLARSDIRTRRRILSSGRVIGNVAFGRGALGLLLKNPIYIGKTRHKERIYQGEHEAIIGDDLFQAVQETLERNNHDKVVGIKTKQPCLLTGILTDPDGKSMSPTRGKKGAKTYCYYTTRIKPGADRDKAWRFPVGEIDPLVIQAVARHLETLALCTTEGTAQLQLKIEVGRSMAENLRCGSTIEQRRLLLELKTSIRLTEESVELTITIPDDKDPEAISVPAKLVRKGNELKLVQHPGGLTSNSPPDPILVKLLAQAFAARDCLMSKTITPCISRYSKRHLQKLARLSWLAPDIVSGILEGRQPSHLTGRYLLRCGDVPLDWPGQREFLGFA